MSENEPEQGGGGVEGGGGSREDGEAGEGKPQSAEGASDNALEPTAEGFLLKNRWKPIKRIGEGAFGQIYSGIDLQTREKIAIKLERSDSRRQVLKQEVSILNKLQGCPHVCRFLHCGRTKEYNFLIMELLGENINELRKRRPEQRFSLGTSLQLVIQMLRAVAGIHALGYLHRDIKASNFVMGDPRNPPTARRCFVVDFGLARRFRTITGEVRPARETVGFRGTARYASINSHLSRELGPRDDLWSLLYVLVEFVVGRLPWTRMKDKQAIGELKMKYNSFELVRDLPAQVWQFMLHIKSIGYSDVANYDHLIHLLESIFSTMHIDRNLPYDWEFSELRLRCPSLGGQDGTLSSSSSVAGSSLPSHRSFSLSSQKSFLSQLAGQGSFGQSSSMRALTAEPGSPGATGDVPWRAQRLGPSTSNPALSVEQRGGADVEDRAEGEVSSVVRKPRPFSASYSQSLGVVRYGPMAMASANYRSYPAALALHDPLPHIKDGAGVLEGSQKEVDRDVMRADGGFFSAGSASLRSPPSPDGRMMVFSSGGDAPAALRSRSPSPVGAVAETDVHSAAAVRSEERRHEDGGTVDGGQGAVGLDDDAVVSDKSGIVQQRRAGAGEGSPAHSSGVSGSKGRDRRPKRSGGGGRSPVGDSPIPETGTSVSVVPAGVDGVESEIEQSAAERHEGDNDAESVPAGMLRQGSYLAMASDDEAGRPSGKRRPVVASGPRPARRRRVGRKKRFRRRRRANADRVPSGTASDDEGAALSTNASKSRPHRMSRLTRCTIL